MHNFQSPDDIVNPVHVSSSESNTAWLVIKVTDLNIGEIEDTNSKGIIRVGSATVRSENHSAPSLAISGHGRTTSPSGTKNTAN